MSAEPLPETQIRRIVADVVDGYRQPIYATPLALMLYRRQITAAQYQAGDEWIRAHAAWEAASEVKVLKCAQLESGLGSEPPDADSAVGRAIAKRQAKAKARFAELDAIARRCGAEHYAVWEDVAVHHKAPSLQERGAVWQVCERLRLWTRAKRYATQRAKRA